MSIQLTSSAFQAGQPIPLDYTDDGRNVSPPLQWTDPPANTQTFALLCEDPDAPHGTFTHWILFDLPAQTRALDEAFSHEPTLLNGATQGINDFETGHYGGPSPPPGKPHRYFFKLYALDKKLFLPPRASKNDLLTEMDGHILDQGELMGTYGRSPDRKGPRL